MFLHRKRNLGSRASDAIAAAELAEANARLAAAKILEEEANAKANAIRERAELAARKRELARTIELAPLEEEARRLEEIRLTGERSRAQANLSLEQANAEQEAKARRRKANVTLTRRFVAAAFVGSTLVAMGGQVSAYHQSMGWWLIAALAVALVTESLALAMQHMANTAYLEGDAAGGLQVGSLLLAGYAGVLNYSHWSDGWAPTPAAAMFAFFSVIPPMLWAAQAKSQHRAQLRAEGRGRPRAPWFAFLRWVLWRGETFAAFAWAVRNGESDPESAVIGLRLDRLTEEADKGVAEARQIVSDAHVSLEGARVSLTEAAWAYLSQAVRPGGESSPEGAKRELGSCESGDDEDDLEPLPDLPDPATLEGMSPADRLTRARITVILARQRGIDLEGRGAELGRAYGRSDKWGQIRVKENLPPMFAIPGSLDTDDFEVAGGE